MKKVGLSLSGGGFKAPIYLGVIKAFEENDIPIDVIGGLSGGSMIGGLYAMGKSVDEIADIAFNIDYYRFLDINPFNGWTILNSERVYNKLKEIVGNTRIEDLKMKYIILASDIDTKEPVIIEKGELADAMMSSSSLPPIMPPHFFEGKNLVDGGFSFKFGAKAFRDAGADVVIGVNLDQWLTDAQLPGIIRDLIRSMRIVMESNAKYEKHFSPIDLEINHFLDTNNMLDFSKMKVSLIDEGYQKAMEFMNEIKKLVK